MGSPRFPTPTGCCRSSLIPSRITRISQRTFTPFYGITLFQDKVGNFVKKKVSECTGREGGAATAPEVRL